MTIARLARLTPAALTAALALALPAVAGAANPADRDRDGMADRWERSHHVASARADQDKDGLTNLGEYRSKTDPRDADSDDDRVSDADEDRDRDHVDNANEMREKTNPADADSDDDGRKDDAEDADKDSVVNGAEDVNGTDPIDADTDGDGVQDGDESSGKITSFTDGVLTIELFDGTALSGMVTAETQIECDSEEDFEDGYEVDDVKGAKPAVVAASVRDRGDKEEGEASSDRREGGKPKPAESGSERPDVEDDGDVEANDDDESGDASHACAATDLTPGKSVHEAELRLGAGGATFVEIELVR